METKSTKISEIKREWHKVDLKGQTLGRIAVEIAHKLMGKSKPYFVHHLDCGDYVVCVNAKDIKVTGSKEKTKVYFKHTLYPTGQKSEVLGDLRKRNPEEIIERAVKGMLPKNKLRALLLKRLFVFSGEDTKYKEKFKGEK